MLRSFVISGVILGGKNDAELKNDIRKTIFQRLGAVLVNLNVNGVFFRGFSFFSLESY